MLLDRGARSERLRLHVILAFLLVELTLFLGRRILVLLVLGDQVVHVALRLRELHFIHALARVPVQERLAAEHAGEPGVFIGFLNHFLRLDEEVGHRPASLPAQRTEHGIV